MCVYVSSVICLSAGKGKMLNRGENRTRDLGVTTPHALPSELHGQPDFETVNYDLRWLPRVLFPGLRSSYICNQNLATLSVELRKHN